MHHGVRPVPLRVRKASKQTNRKEGKRESEQRRTRRNKTKEEPITLASRIARQHQCCSQHRPKPSATKYIFNLPWPFHSSISKKRKKTEESGQTQTQTSTDEHRNEQTKNKQNRQTSESINEQKETGKSINCQQKCASN